MFEDFLDAKDHLITYWDPQLISILVRTILNSYVICMYTQISKILGIMFFFSIQLLCLINS